MSNTSPTNAADAPGCSISAATSPSIVSDTARCGSPVTGSGAIRPTVTGPRRRVRRAVELGVTFIDTADSYGPDVSEKLIAEALHPYPDDLVIATKGGLERPGPGRVAPERPARAPVAACEGSLRRLRLEQIPLYQFHRPTRRCRSRTPSARWAS